MTYFKPGHVTERFAGQPTFSDCALCSGILLNRARQGSNATPGTKAEVLALRQAGGAAATGPITNVQLEQGLRYRYGLTVQTVYGPANIVNALPPGKAAAVFGYLARYPAGHRLRRWDPSYAGGHVVFVERLDAQNRLWWMDPLAPLKYGTRTPRTYLGEWVTLAEFATFIDSTKAPVGKGRTALIASAAVLVAPAHTLHIAAGTTMLHSATLSRGCIASYQDIPHDGSAAVYPSGPGVTTPGCIRGSAVLAIPSSGPYAGRRLRVNAAEGTSVT